MEITIQHVAIVSQRVKVGKKITFASIDAINVIFDPLRKTD